MATEAWEQFQNADDQISPNTNSADKVFDFGDHLGNSFEKGGHEEPANTGIRDRALNLAYRVGSIFEDDDANQAPAPETDFAAQASELSWNQGGRQDFRRLSSLCLDLQETCEEYGSNRDIRQACRLLLNRDGVPQRLRSMLWSQLLRSNASGSDADDEDEEDDVARRASAPNPTVRDLESGILAHMAAGNSDPAVRRVSEMDKRRYGRAQKTGRAPQHKGQTDLGTIHEDPEGFTRSFQFPQKVSNDASPLPTKGKVEQVRIGNQVREKVGGLEKVDEEDTTLGQALEHSADEQHCEEKTALQALGKLGLNSPSGLGECACVVECHCVCGTACLPTLDSEEPSITARDGQAALPPLEKQPLIAEPSPEYLTVEPRLDLKWYDKGGKAAGKMPAGKRDSIQTAPRDQS